LKGEESISKVKNIKPFPPTSFSFGAFVLILGQAVARIEFPIRYSRIKLRSGSPFRGIVASAEDVGGIKKRGNLGQDGPVLNAAMRRQLIFSLMVLVAAVVEVGHAQTQIVVILLPLSILALAGAIQFSALAQFFRGYDRYR